MDIKINTLCLIRIPVHCLDIGVIEKIHQTAPSFELRTILQKNRRCYQCNLIPLVEMPEGITDIEEAVKELFLWSEYPLLKKITAGEKITEVEIYLIEETFRTDPNEKPIEDL